MKDNFGCDNFFELGMSDKFYFMVMGFKKVFVMVSCFVKKIFDLLNDVGVLFLYFDGFVFEVMFVDLVVVFVVFIFDFVYLLFIVYYMNIWNNVMC